MAFRQLNKLRTVALHYRDIVQIPKPDTGVIRLEDYFTVCPRVPEKIFGALTNFKLSLELPNFCEHASIILAIQSASTQEREETHCSFDMDWHLTPKHEVTDVDVCRKWLDDTHDIVFDAFKSAFTEKGFALFDREGNK
jgi:hypothetical protein